MLLDKRGKAYDIGKQNRDVLALAFQGTAGSENFLREIRRGVGT